MPLPRFLAPSLDPDARELTLPADEARHLTRVLRLGAGARVVVFDGRGREFVATVTAASRDRVVVRLEEAVVRSADPLTTITLAQAILKGTKMDDVVRDATMIGAGEIVPLITEHMSVKPSAIARGNPEERWARIAVASAKQCGRATVPAVHPPVSLDVWLGWRRSEEELTLMLVEPALGDARARSLRELVFTTPPVRASVVVGPEGGWSAGEVEASVARGCQLVTLGPLTLRADAVPIVALSVLRVLWEVQAG
jgi:16S rRNA (uracil1498-N3)-methyltransferase